MSDTTLQIAAGPQQQAPQPAWPNLVVAIVELFLDLDFRLQAIYREIHQDGGKACQDLNPYCCKLPRYIHAIRKWCNTMRAKDLEDLGTVLEARTAMKVRNISIEALHRCEKFQQYPRLLMLDSPRHFGPIWFRNARRQCFVQVKGQLKQIFELLTGSANLSTRLMIKRRLGESLETMANVVRDPLISLGTLDLNWWAIANNFCAWARIAIIGRIPIDELLEDHDENEREALEQYMCRLLFAVDMQLRSCLASPQSSLSTPQREAMLQSRHNINRLLSMPFHFRYGMRAWSYRMDDLQSCIEQQQRGRHTDCRCDPSLQMADFALRKMHETMQELLMYVHRV